MTPDEIQAVAQLAVLALLFGVMTAFKGFRQLRDAKAERERAEALRKDQARIAADLQEFIELINYGAVEEAIQFGRECGFAVNHVRETR